MFLRHLLSSTAPVQVVDLNTAMTFREMVEATKLEHHARQLAIKGEPPQQHAGLTVHESDAIDLLEGRNRARSAELEVRKLALQQLLQTLTANPDLDPTILHHRTVNALTQIASARAPVIRETLATERTRAAELTAWRDEHKVARPAEYPKSKLVHFRWLGATAGVETVAQSTLLMPATTDGLVGVLGLALGSTAITTGLGLVIGFAGLRYLAASSPAKRLAAWLSLPALGSALLLVSLYVAHYRHVAGASNDTPNDAQVIDHLLTQPFDLTGPGWLLLILSLACAAFAAWKGYTASDPIPGYEKIDRAHVAARDDHDYLRTDIQGAIASLKIKTVKSLMDQPQLVRLKRDHLLGLAAELEAKAEQNTNLAKQEAALVQRVIVHFRRVNLATRADGVTPTYFSEPLDLPSYEATLPAGLKERVATATANAVAEAQKAAGQALQIARMLDHTSDRADEIMTSIDHARPRNGDNPILALRDVLEASLDAAALPKPETKGAIAAPDAPKS